MATNGNNPHPQQIPPAPTISAPPPTEAALALLSMTARLGQHCRDMGDTLVEDATADRKDAYAFSNHVMDLFRNWSANLLARKQRELAELEKFIGQVGK
jgi:hypothetical protein